MLIDLGTGEVDLNITPWTLVVYEQEFRGDMIQDLLGKVVVKNEEEEAGTFVVFDYRDANWTSCLKTMWACLKASDDSTPSFKKWSQTVGSVNVLDIYNKLVPLVEESLFRSGGTASE